VAHQAKWNVWRVLVPAGVLALTLSACSHTSSSPASPSTAEAAHAVSVTPWDPNVTITIGSTSWKFSSNGIPDQYMQAKYPVPKTGVNIKTATISAANSELATNPATPQTQDYTIPLKPVWTTTTTTTPAGTVGVTIGGAMLFNPYEASHTVANDNNFELGGYSFIDACGGHSTPAPMDMYHYHGIPTCLADSVNKPGHFSKILGWALDGYPIYGPDGTNGVKVTGLDKCNGIFSSTPEFPHGTYHYVLTSTFPYSIRCFHGKVNPKYLVWPRS
jgi:hypothetical protein